MKILINVIYAISVLALIGIYSCTKPPKETKDTTLEDKQAYPSTTDTTQTRRLPPNTPIPL